MAAYEVLLLNTAVPQIQAAQSGDTYVVPRDIAFSAALTLSAGTANGVPYLNASKVLTTGSALTLDASGNLGVGTTSPSHRIDADGNIRSNAWLGRANASAPTADCAVFRPADNTLGFSTNNNERARITSGGNLKIGGTADRATTEGDKQLVLFNGTAPVGTLTNGVSFYSASGEARVMDAAGNSTLLSPHDQTTNEWIFHSKHTPTGKVLRIDVERLLKFVNDHFGLDAVHEFIEE